MLYNGDSGVRSYLLKLVTVSGLDLNCYTCFYAQPGKIYLSSKRKNQLLMAFFPLQV